MKTRQKDSIVFVAGNMTPMVVLEPDQYRDWRDRTRRRQIRLRPQNQPDDRGKWWLSDSVTG